MAELVCGDAGRVSYCGVLEREKKVVIIIWGERLRGWGFGKMCV